MRPASYRLHGNDWGILYDQGRFRELTTGVMKDRSGIVVVYLIDSSVHLDDRVVRWFPQSCDWSKLGIKLMQTADRVP